MPFLIPRFHLVLAIAFVVVVVELGVITLDSPSLHGHADGIGCNAGGVGWRSSLCYRRTDRQFVNPSLERSAFLTTKENGRDP